MFVALSVPDKAKDMTVNFSSTDKYSAFSVLYNIIKPVLLL